MFRLIIFRLDGILSVHTVPTKHTELCVYNDLRQYVVTEKRLHFMYLQPCYRYNAYYLML